MKKRERRYYKKYRIVPYSSYWVVCFGNESHGFLVKTLKEAKKEILTLVKENNTTSQI